MTLTFSSKKRRYSVYDVLIDTSVDSQLYMEKNNNNNKFIGKLFPISYIFVAHSSLYRFYPIFLIN
ncbi:unnamed protein product [Strongylus vulgaris]|uniref:Uncharacterized protein n=1 Tax=Strongylus vulgaris TaxID=40348 RepID=A0A3P7ITX5_STRVU|nr:unnamed protein product [Strongylus vulgaris]